MTLKDQTVVVLGGSSGIGLATAAAAQAEGATVVITGRDTAKLEAARKTLGAGASAHVLDATDEAGTKRLFDGLARVDHVFITAGALVKDPRLAPERSALAPALDVRFWGAAYATKYAAPKMGDGGSIVFMSGTAAVRPIIGASVATASCAAVEAFARALALDLAPIRVNVIQPGFIDTPLLDGLLGARKAEVLANVAAKLPAKRIGRSDEVADAVLFLMKNRYVTGITLTIDGGGLLV